MKTRNCHGIDCGDWESIGQEEMNELAKKARSITEIRDEVELIKDIITVCCEALRHSNMSSIKEVVSNILYFRVFNPLEDIETELRNL